MINHAVPSWFKHARDAALVLAAHGSGDDPRCAAPVLRLVDRFRSGREFAEVIAVFWKQRPHFREVWELISSEDVLVVPVMTAGGYYARRVLPRELSLSYPPLGHRVVMTEALGELPEMAELIVDQALDAATDADVDCRDAHLLIVGHGTMQHPKASGATTHAHADSISRQGLFRQVHVAFLEQRPLIPEAMQSMAGDQPIIVVPFLIADGTHAMRDVRRACGAESEVGLHRANGRKIVFGRAAGESAGLFKLIYIAVHNALRSTMLSEALPA